MTPAAGHSLAMRRQLAHVNAAAIARLLAAVPNDRFEPPRAIHRRLGEGALATVRWQLKLLADLGELTAIPARPPGHHGRLYRRS